MSHCYHCGREITTPTKAVTILVVESSTGRIGTGHLHCNCCNESFSRYRQTVTWDGATLGNLGAFKRLHGRIAAANRSSWNSVPVLLA
jgi:hypothetical protein